MKILHAMPEEATVIAMSLSGCLYELNQKLDPTRHDSDDEGTYTSQALQVCSKVAMKGEIQLKYWSKLEDQKSTCWSSNCTKGHWLKPAPNGKGAIAGGVCAGCLGKGHMSAEDRKRFHFYNKYGRQLSA